MEYPTEGVILGQGWDSFKNTPSTDLCIKFGSSSMKGHEISINYKNITNRLELNKALNLSVSGSYSGYGVKGGAKAEYSNSLKVDNRFTNIMASINVWMNDTFTAPFILSGNKTEYLPIELTDKAAKLLTQGKFFEFRLRCGDSFVSNIREGSTLNAFFQYSNLSNEVKSSLSASMAASGWGAKLEASSKVTEALKNSRTSTKINIFQSGGPFQPIPVDTENLNLMVNNFLKVEGESSYPTKPYLIGIQNYKKLHNWRISNQDGTPEKMRALITLYWLYEDLRKTYVYSLQNSNLYLINDSSQWDITKSLFTFIDSELCEYKHDAASKSWKSTVSKCNSVAEEKVTGNLWSLNKVILNLEKISTITEFLETSVNGCFSKNLGYLSYENCNSNGALLVAAKKFDDFHKNNKPDAKAVSNFKGNYDLQQANGKVYSPKENEIWHIVNDIFYIKGNNILSDNSLLEGIIPQQNTLYLDTIDKMSKVCEKNSKKINDCVKHKSDSMKIAQQQAAYSFEQLIKDYYRFSFMAPVQIKEAGYPLEASAHHI